MPTLPVPSKSIGTISLKAFASLVSLLHFGDCQDISTLYQQKDDWLQMIVTFLVIMYFSPFFKALPWLIWDLSSLTSGGTRASCRGSVESLALDLQASLGITYFLTGV